MEEDKQKGVIAIGLTALVAVIAAVMSFESFKVICEAGVCISELANVGSNLKPKRKNGGNNWEVGAPFGIRQGKKSLKGQD